VLRLSGVTVPARRVQNIRGEAALVPQATADRAAGEGQTSQELRQEASPDVATTDHTHHGGPRSRNHPARDEGGQGGGTRRLGGELAPLDKHAKRIEDRLVAYPHHLVHEALDVGEGVLTGEWR
jgi:hypothetical protein